MAALLHGELNAAVEDWVSYTERRNNISLQIVLQLVKERNVGLGVCGPSTYQLIRSLVSPAKTTDKSYAQLVRLVQEHQQPTPSFIVQRYTISTLR